MNKGKCTILNKIFYVVSPGLVRLALNKDKKRLYPSNTAFSSHSHIASIYTVTYDSRTLYLYIFMVIPDNAKNRKKDWLLTARNV